MEKKPELPRSNLGRPIAAASAAIGGGGGDANLNLTSSTSSSSSLSISPPDFLSQVNAVFKRHRPLGTMQNFSGANRVLVRQAEPSRNSTEPSNNSTSTTSVAGKKLPQTVGKRGTERFLNIGFDKRKDNELQVRSNTLEDSSLNTPSITGTVTNLGNGIDPIRMQQGEGEVLIDREKPCLPASSSHLLYSMVSSNDNSKKSADNSVLTFQSVDARMTIDTRMDDISSYLHSLALTEGEGQFVNQVRGNNEDLKPHDPLNMEIYGNNGSHMMEKITDLSHNNQIMHPMTHSSVVGSSHQSTTMSVHSGPTYQCTHAPSAAHTEFPIQKLSSENNLSGVPSHIVTEGQEPIMIEGEDIREKVFSSNASHLQSQVLAPIHKSSNADVEPSQPSKVEKAPRKKKYDPDVFFKVNGKLYQKLGKIGSGGSSEVHKVITSDCTIYALKKIKLKGRDYPTAYGFCQEIKYLNRLKGKSNIIQLIDYEVTDKTLLQEVLDGSMTIKDGRIKDDQYIYMVLEYGEIDLAHMLSQKLKEAESSSLKIDDNWLRFYWQQMLEAVNTIHEERIVHSDLKPANFMLVRGSLKLIDFGIAKAILSDTTNIQRDAQVGTLNYMSPEAFTFNEADTSTNANTIKLGRPSDIWSLGCILYQMVYGTTPFSQYKTFWNKYKAITDKNHEITYEPISNPLLIDLMKRCLAWDRNERWRIPQLLQHQFLMPRVSRDWSVLERISLHSSDPEVNRLWEELGRVVDELERENKEQF